MSRPYLEALVTQPTVSYIPCATLSHEKNGDIITFAHFEEGYLVENERNVAEDESTLSAIDESSTDDDSYGGYLSTNSLEEIWGGKYIHPCINARGDIFKIRERIRKISD